MIIPLYLLQVHRLHHFVQSFHYTSHLLGQLKQNHIICTFVEYE